MADNRQAVRSEAEAELPNLLPARMLNEFIYCPRLFYYEWVEGIFAHNVETVEGALRHEKAERKEPSSLPPAEEAGEQGERIHARSVSLNSAEHGLIANIDIVEGEGGRVCPVDYKRGRPRETEEGGIEVWDADRIQLAVQALVLRANGHTCDGRGMPSNLTSSTPCRRRRARKARRRARFAGSSRRETTCGRSI